MIGFLVHLIKLAAAIRDGFKQDPEFRALLYVLFTLLASSSVFYWHIEGWSLVDSLYFSVMTMSTIGYGDFTPTTTLSKLFTIVFALLSIGVFVAVVSKLVEIVLKRTKNTASKLKRFAATHGAHAEPNHDEQTGGKQ